VVLGEIVQKIGVGFGHFYWIMAGGISIRQKSKNPRGAGG
jgi:hypothetical protein